MTLANIRVVLDHPSHPGNVGATARAMKVMGLSQLALIRGADPDCSEAVARASGAGDLLEGALRVETLAEAVAGCPLVIACSARRRDGTRPQLTVRAAAELAVTESVTHPVAILFGTERTGLPKEALDLSHVHLCIDTAPDFWSLNLAMAVQVVCHELLQASLQQAAVAAQVPAVVEPVAPQDEVEGMYGHLESALIGSGFLRPDHRGNVIRRLRDVFQRARLTSYEVNLVRGCLKSLERPRR